MEKQGELRLVVIRKLAREVVHDYENWCEHIDDPDPEKLEEMIVEKFGLHPAASPVGMAGLRELVKETAAIRQRGETTVSDETKCQHVKDSMLLLKRLEGPLHPGGKDYVCACGQQFRVQPLEIGVEFGKPPAYSKQPDYVPPAEPADAK